MPAGRAESLLDGVTAVAELLGIVPHDCVACLTSSAFLVRVTWDTWTWIQCQNAPRHDAPHDKQVHEDLDTFGHRAAVAVAEWSCSLELVN